jgi:hypothetical protein
LAAAPPLTIALLAACLAAPVARADERSDSAAYEAKRQLLLGEGPDEREGAILSAAEDLARDGYYSEALDLVFSMQDPAKADWEGEFDRSLAAAIATPAPAKANRPFGYLQSGIDYDLWNGVDTILTAHVRGKVEWDPPGRAFERAAVVAHASDRNTYFDAIAKGAIAGRLLRFEAEALAEKMLWQPYRDSLDRVYLAARLNPTSRPLGQPLAAEAPLFVETEFFRHDRFASHSRYAAGIAPGLQAMSENTTKSLLLSWNARAQAYPASPGYSFYRDGPVASGWWYGDRMTLDAETRLSTTRYRRDTSLVRDRRLETLVGGSIRVWRWFKMGLRAAGDTEYGDYRDSVSSSFDTVRADYRLTGSTWSLRPQLAAEWRGAYSASLGLSFTRARYPILAEAGGISLANPLYLNTSSDDWKAEAGFTMLTKAIFLTVSLDYEENWVPYNPDYALGSSGGAGLAGSLSWKLRPWFEIDATVQAARRLWLARGYTGGMLSDNLLLSIGVTSDFP